MANDVKKNNYLKVKKFLAGLQNMIDSLPNEDEKQAIQRNITTIIDFLEMVQRNLSLLPSLEKMDKTKESLQKIEELFAKAQREPVLSSIIGLRSRSTRKRAKIEFTEEETARAKTILNELELLPIDEIKSKLEDGTYSLKIIRAIAKVMGIKTVEKLSTKALIHQISVKIANYRGYRQLKEGKSI